MTDRYRGIVIANNTEQAHNGLDRLHGLLQVDKTGPANYRDWLIITRNNWNTAVRGQYIPNRIVVFDLSPQAITIDMWNAIIPALRRENGEQINVTYISRERLRTDLISDHVFTVRRQDGIGPHAPDLPCAFPVSNRKPTPEYCGMRADQHMARPLARAAEDLTR